MCDFLDKRVTPPLLFKQAIIAPNKLIGSQHYQRLTTHAVKSITPKNFKLLQNYLCFSIEHARARHAPRDALDAKFICE